MAIKRYVIGILLVVLISSLASAAEPKRLRVGILLAGEFSITYIAYRKGLFQKYGLDPELVYFQGGSQVIQAMLGGDIPLTVTAGPEGVAAKLQGADILLLSTNNPTMAFTLFVAPEIKKVADLKRKRAGISRFGSSTDFSLRYILKSQGLSEKDVVIVQIGDNPSRLAALKSKAIDASVFTVPNSVRARKAGFVGLVDAYKLGLKFHGSGIATTSAFMREHEPIVEQFFKGFLEGVHFAKTHEEESVRLIKEFMHLKEDDEAEETYSVMVQEIQPRKPYPLKEGVETVLKTLESSMPKARTARAEDFIDDTSIRKLDESGFIDNLYK
jgi:NitT/TauT family transport system substrate-binding protein